MFEQGRAALDPAATLRRALCPNGDKVVYRDRRLHVAAWAKQFLFRSEQLDVPVGDLSGGEQARVRIAQLMLRPADLLLLDEPTNDLDIPALEVLEESLAEFPGALVIVSHDRDLMDRLCTEVVGLDGRGGSALYGSVGQWLTAYERSVEEAARPTKPAAAPAGTSPAARPEAAQAQLERAARIGGHGGRHPRRRGGRRRPAGRGRTGRDGRPCGPGRGVPVLEEAQKTVERLYARWQELEARRGS